MRYMYKIQEIEIQVKSNFQYQISDKKLGNDLNGSYYLAKV